MSATDADGQAGRLCRPGSGSGGRTTRLGSPGPRLPASAACTGEHRHCGRGTIQRHRDLRLDAVGVAGEPEEPDAAAR